MGEIQAGIAEGVIANVAAEGVSAGASLGGVSHLGVDLIADFEANGGGVGEIGVVTADVQRDGEIEEGFAGLERDGRTTGFGLSDSRRNLGGRFFRDGCVGSGVRVAAAR